MDAENSAANERAQLRIEVERLRAENRALRARNARLCLSDLRLRQLLDSEIIGVLMGDAERPNFGSQPFRLNAWSGVRVRK